MPTRIPTHRPAGVGTISKAHSRDYDRARQDKRAFYWSTLWLKLRKAHLIANPLCANCLRQGKLTPATHVHHVVSRDAAPERELDPTNLESACPPCHNSIEPRTPKQ